MCKLAGCSINHPGWINCKVAARAAVVNIQPDKAEVVVNTKPESAPAVVNKSRTKDRHKKVRREYFKNYMAILRQTPKAIAAGLALPYLKPSELGVKAA